MDSFLHKLFPNNIDDEINRLITAYEIAPEEIRLRLGQAPVLRSMNREYVCDRVTVSEKDMVYIMMNATNGAFHAAIDSIQNGYLSLPNGCRLGICGTGAVTDHKIHNMKHISSLCLRIARESLGCADSIIKTYYASQFLNTIIIAPPGIGKTTLLRECIRKLSYHGFYIGVGDERGEISGMYRGKPSFDLGCRTDVICGVEKAQAASMLLRTMSPDIIAMDEISSFRDLPAITEAIGCGVGLLTTIHGKDVSDLSKPNFREILSTKAFQLAIIISIENNQRVYTAENIHV